MNNIFIEFHQLMDTMSATLVGLIFIVAMLYLQNVKEIFQQLKERIPRARMSFPYYLIASAFLELIILSIPLYIYFNTLFADNYYIKFFNSIVTISVFSVFCFITWKTRHYFYGKISQLMKMTKIKFLRLCLSPLAAVILMVLFFLPYVRVMTWNPKTILIISSTSLVLGMVIIFMDIFLSHPESLLLLVEKEFVSHIGMPLNEIIDKTFQMKVSISRNQQLDELKELLENIHKEMSYFRDKVFPLIKSTNVIVASDIMLQLERYELLKELSKQNKYRELFLHHKFNF